MLRELLNLPFKGLVCMNEPERRGVTLFKRKTIKLSQPKRDPSEKLSKNKPHETVHFDVFRSCAHGVLGLAF
jgi:hypothetical protein